MPLKAVLETLDGVDDALKPLYTEADGKFALQIEGVDDHPEVVNLKTAHMRTKTEREALKSTLLQAQERLKTIPDDFDPKVWASAKSGKPDDAALVKIRGELEAELGAWKSKAEKAEDRANRFVIERDMTDALSANGVVDPTFQKAARAILMGAKVKVENEKALVETDMGDLPVADHVKRWVASEGKAFVNQAKGGGAGGGNGNGTAKTVTRSHFNAMSQAERAAHTKSGGKVVD